LTATRARDIFQKATNQGVLMKKIALSLAAAFAVLSAAAQSSMDPVKPGELQIAQKVVTLQRWAESADQQIGASAARLLQLTVLNTNATVDTALVVPAFVGQVMIGTVSNKVWISEGTTTNSWILLN